MPISTTDEKLSNNMNSEELILNAIANACKDQRLRFQNIIRDSVLHIYINRPSGATLNYHQLKHRIYEAIAGLSSLKFRKIWLYCRILGQVEPDWQSVLEIEASNLAADEMVSMVKRITTALDATNSIVDKIEQELAIPESFTEDPLVDFEDLPTTASDEPEVWDLSESELSELLEGSVLELSQEGEIISDFSNYCFIRNRRLLYAVLDPPWSKIAHLINTFDQFEESNKRSQLPILEAYFEESINPDINNFTPETKAWWTKIQELDSDNRHKLAIWLSRYCSDSQQTISTIQEVITAQAAAPKTKNAELEPAATDNLSAEPNSDVQTSSSVDQQSSHQIEDSRNSNFKGESGWLKSLTTFIGKLWKTENIDKTK